MRFSKERVTPLSPVRFLLPGLGFVLIGLPMIEIALFVIIGGQIGVLGTLAAVIATGVIGAAVLSQQGMATLERMNRNLDAGEIPIQEVFEGFLMVIAAVLLITPGFATDAIGFALTVPGIRALIANRLKSRAQVYVHRQGHEASRNRQDPFANDTPRPGPRNPRDKVIEGELIEPSSAPDTNTPH